MMIHNNEKPYARPATLTRIQRAQVVRDRILEHSNAHGRWKTFEWEEGHSARVWSIEPTPSWSAQLSTRFSLSSHAEVLIAGYDEAPLLQLAPPRWDDIVLDLYVHPASKVLSLGTTHGVDRLITMQPGPWEEMFGLASRPWTSRVARRLASHESRASAVGS